jgi:hypothetical protein
VDLRIIIGSACQWIRGSLLLDWPLNCLWRFTCVRLPLTSNHLPLSAFVVTASELLPVLGARAPLLVTTHDKSRQARQSRSARQLLCMTAASAG